MPKKYYVVPDVACVSMDDDGTVSVRLKVFDGDVDRDEPIEIVLNLGDDKESIWRFLNRIYLMIEDLIENKNRDSRFRAR